MFYLSCGDGCLGGYEEEGSKASESNGKAAKDSTNPSPCCNLHHPS